MAGITDWWNNGPGSFFTDGARNAANFAGSLGNWLMSRQDYPIGKGPGDQMFGAPRSNGVRRASGGGSFGDPAPVPSPDPGPSPTPLPSIADALAQARALMGQFGGGTPGMIDVGAISWDPLRQDARNRAAEYDAKLASMYNALTNSVRTGDAQAIRDNFQGALSDSRATTDRTTQAIQGASDAANQKNIDVLQALGQGEAAANIIARGQDLPTQAANAVANAAARGQTAQNALSQKQQTALDANTGMAGAYGLQGAEARDNIQSQLSSLLANYGMQEQQARQQAQQQNAQVMSGQNNALFSLANQILGNDWNQIKYGDSLAQQQLQMLQQQAQQQAKQGQQSQVQDFMTNILNQGGSLKDYTGYLPYLYPRQ